MQPCVFIKREAEGQSGVETWTSTTRETKRSNIDWVMDSKLKL